MFVEADVFADVHDLIDCQILYWQDKKELRTSPMRPVKSHPSQGYVVCTLCMTRCIQLAES